MDFGDIIGEEKSVIAEYFTEDQWNKLSNFEKTDIYDTLKRYLTFKDYKGVNIPPPDFMLKRKRLNDGSDSKQSTDKNEAVFVNGESAGKRSSRLEYGYQNPCTSKDNADYNQPQKKTPRKSVRKQDNTYSEKNAEGPPKKYPKRSVPAKNYHEPEEPNDDRYVFCDNCEEDCVDYCKTCGKLAFLKAYPVRMNTADRARKTCPKGILEVRPSNIHGFGVFALKALPKGVQMGPYEGQAAKQETKTGYAWKLRNGKLIDAADERNSNYLRYVNCARNSHEQNLVAFQYDGKLFYRTCKNIAPDEELLVYYGHSFAKTLGIDPKKFYEPNTNKVIDYYTCQYCHIGLSTQQFRDSHQRRCRYRPENIITFDLNQAVTCQYCCRVFDNDGDLEKHENECFYRKKTGLEEEEKRFKCSECSCTTYTASNFKRHNLIHNKVENKKFACFQCKYSTICKGSLISHVSRIHSKKHISAKSVEYYCQSCKKVFKTKQSLDNHILRHHPSQIDLVSSKIHKCHISKCEYATTKTIYLHEHILRHSHENAPSFDCTICQYKTYRKSDYNRHFKSHLEIKPLICTECHKSFATKDQLDNHILVHHKNNFLLMKSITSKIHSCKNCNYKTTFSSNFKNHLITHELKKSIDNLKENIQYFHCSTCQYKTYRKSNYNQHLKIHLKEKPSRCTECGKTFAQKMQLDSHILNRHIDNVLLMKSITSNIHSCQHCDYKVVHIGKLKKHLKKHNL